jgi:tripeptidyl-peptidase-1
VNNVNSCRYHIPEYLVSHIDYITPGIKLIPVVKSIKTKRALAFKQRKMNYISLHSPSFDGIPWDWMPAAAAGLPTDLQGCGRNITPACVKALYGIPDPNKVAPGNSLGLFEQGDYFAKSDLDLFYAEYAPYVPQGTYPIPALIDGANFSVPAHSPLNGGESDIDIDIA